MMFKHFLIILAMLSTPFKLMAETIKDSITMSYSYYSDNVGVEVKSPFISLQRRLNEKWGMTASFQADAISAASMRRGNGNVTDTVIMDAVSGASGRAGFDDLRVAPTVSFTYEEDDLVWNFGMYYSNEVDYETAAGFMEISSGFNDANTVLSLGGSYETAKWEPIINRALDEDSKTQRQINASVMQLLDDSSYLQFRGSYIVQDGFLSSPYHYLIGDDFAQFDRYPDTRTSTALAVQYVTSPAEATSVHVNYRYYEDDWEITSHTLEGNVFYDVMENLTLGARGRYYMQDAAAFAKGLDNYSVDDDYIVSDYKFSEFDTITIGASLHYKPGFFEDEAIALQISYDYYTTDDNAYIKNWYGASKIEAEMVTFALTYDF